MTEVFMGAPRMPVTEHVEADREQRRVVEMACSLLLDYPADELADQVDAVRAELAALPAEVAEHLEGFCTHAEALGLRALREHYVETFDQRRRCALYLSYYVEGDTRGRGQAILAFREIMRAAGFEQQREELTDYLPVVLEFAALDEQGMGEELLQTHREGLEVIRAALVDAGSPYAELLEALVTVLPEPDEKTIAAYHKLISQGPPTELVGLSDGPGVASPPATAPCSTRSTGARRPARVSRPSHRSYRRRADAMSAASILAWVVLPYLSIVLLIGGLIWRFRTDQFGWTSKSSQWRESAILRWSSPLFHLGILFVALGHVMGLVIPQGLTDALGVSHHLYHLVATIPGSIAGVAAVVGLCGLLYRRIVVKSVRLNTSRADILTYVLLTIPVLLGAAATFSTQVFGEPGGYNYRETISVWFRSIPALHPQPELMADVPTVFKAHIIAGMLLFCIWPFTKLVHVVSAPVGYVTRPNVVYRSRTADSAVASAPAARGWERPFESAGGKRR